MMLRLSCAGLFASLCLLPLAPGRAQQAVTSQDLANLHPSAASVIGYLKSAVQRDYEKAAALIQPSSLADMQKDYVRRLKNPSVPYDEVSGMCRAVGKKDEDEVEKMRPVEFYLAYQKSLQTRYNVTDDENKRIMNTLELNLLSVAEERPDLVHVLVRTQHKTSKAKVSNLELVSLVKEGGKWLVALGEQRAKVTPLEDAKAPAPEK